MPFSSFYSRLLRLPRNWLGNPNRNQREMNQNYLGNCRERSAHLFCWVVDWVYKLFKFNWNLSLRVCYELKLWRPRTSNRVYGLVEGRSVRNWALLNPAEPLWAAGHLFSANTRKLLHLTITPSTRKPVSAHPTQPSLPPNAENVSSRDSDPSYHNSMNPLPWITPILCSDLWVPAGHDCRHRWESRPMIASICHIALVSWRFVLFFLSIFHLFLCLLLKMGWNEGVRGSSAMPINMFHRKVGIRPQLEVCILLNDYSGVKDCKVKTTTFYCQKADRR